jgi:hypothetical protein
VAVSGITLPVKRVHTSLVPFSLDALDRSSSSSACSPVPKGTRQSKLSSLPVGVDVPPNSGLTLTAPPSFNRTSAPNVASTK